MTFLITKASNDDYMTFKVINSLDELLIFKESIKVNIVISNSLYYNQDPNWIRQFFDISLEKAKMISKIKYEILIYDDYIE